MLNVPELERRWRRYRIKRYIPLTAGAAIASVSLLIGLYFFLESEPEPVAHSTITAKEKYSAPQTKPITPAQTVAEIPNDNASTPLKEPEPVTVSEQTKEIPPQMPVAAKVHEVQTPPPTPTTKLTPSMQFLQDFESDVMKYYGVETPKKNEPVLESNDIIPPPPVEEERVVEAPVQLMPTESPKQTIPTEMPKTTMKPTPPPTTSQMIIQRENDLKDIQDVIMRFKKNKNPALSLFVARRYYALGNYQQAYNYALITNDLNSHIEDSWLIFAKSLYKLDQKEMAQKTLSSYIKENGSIKAKLLLEQMRNGTFQ